MMTNALSLSRQRFVSVLVIAVATLLAWPSPARAQLKVIISGGFSTAFRQVLPEFERSTGITVTTLSGASQGTGPETIAAQLSRGVPADARDSGSQTNSARRSCHAARSPPHWSHPEMQAFVVQPISELLHVPGIDFVGPIPAELQLIQTFAAAIVAGSKELEASRKLIAFLVSDRAAAAIKDNGMEPVEKR
jgi:ABC-type molybdate transport system substrate-binding protein